MSFPEHYTNNTSINSSSFSNEELPKIHSDFLKTFYSHINSLLFNGIPINKKYNVEASKYCFEYFGKATIEEDCFLKKGEIDESKEDCDDETQEFIDQVGEQIQTSLSQTLGEKREHLLPEILKQLSTRVFSEIACTIQTKAAEKYNGLVIGEKPEYVCDLQIKNEGPVTLVTGISGSYDKIIRPGKNELETFEQPHKYTGTAIYTIGLDGSTNTVLDFHLD